MRGRPPRDYLQVVKENIRTRASERYASSLCLLATLKKEAKLDIGRTEPTEGGRPSALLKSLTDASNEFCTPDHRRILCMHKRRMRPPEICRCSSNSAALKKAACIVSSRYKARYMACQAAFRKSLMYVIFLLPAARLDFARCMRPTENYGALLATERGPINASHRDPKIYTRASERAKPCSQPGESRRSMEGHNWGNWGYRQALDVNLGQFERKINRTLRHAGRLRPPPRQDTSRMYVSATSTSLAPMTGRARS